MSLGEAFCVVCGSSEPLTSNRLCESCFRERVTLSELTETIQGVRCPKCSVVLYSGRWVNIPDEELHYGVVQQELAVDERASGLEVGIHAEPVDERNTRLTVQTVGEIDGLALGLPLGEIDSDAGFAYTQLLEMLTHVLGSFLHM